MARNAFTLLREDQPEMVVDHLSARSDCEVRGDQPCRPFKLTLTALHPPIDRPVLQAGIGAASEISLADRAEPERVPAAEVDRAGLEEARFSGERNGRF